MIASHSKLLPSPRRRCFVPVARAAPPRQASAPPRRVDDRAEPSSQPRAHEPTRYRLARRLGAGGTAEVFEAALVGADGFAKTVAVKRLLPALESSLHYECMFLEEARLASRLSHPNVLPVLDFGRDKEARPFIVMEHVDGVDLAQLVGTGIVPCSVAVFIASEVLSGLCYLHDRPSGGRVTGLVHRDLSPHNVLLSRQGAVKIADFGLAKAMEGAMAPASGLIRGKANYMSPEQLNGKELDGRSDLFAVGAVLWELLAGRRLFDGTPREAMAQVLFRSVERPSEHRPEIPDDVERVVMRLLERDRDARYPTAELALDELAKCRDAPRHGRAELARLLAERFPNEPTSSPEPCRASASSAERPRGGGTETQPPGLHQEAPPWQPWPDDSEIEAYAAAWTRRRWIQRALIAIVALMIPLALALLSGR